MRDITLGDTFYHFFTTRAFATGVPTTLAGTPVLSVLEENNATPITAGVSVSVDRASVTGLNQATIVATGGNGYEVGKSYAIYISTGTVGGTSVVGEVVGHFTIQASAAAVDLANGTDGLGAIKTETSSIQTDTNDIQARIPAALTAGGNIKADALAWAGAATATDDIALKASLAKGTDITGFNDLSAAQVNAEVDAALDTAIPGSPTANSVNERVATMDGLLLGTVAAGTHNPQSGDAFARLGAPAGASVSADVAAVKADTGATIAAVDTEVAAIKTQTDKLTFDGSNRVSSNVETMASGVLTAAALAAAACNKIADHILRRTYANARQSSDGDAVAFRSLLGAIGKLVNRWAISGTTLTVYQENDVTSTAPGGTQTVTTTAGNPVSEVNTD